MYNLITAINYKTEKTTNKPFVNLNNYGVCMYIYIYIILTN